VMVNGAGLQFINTRELGSSAAIEANALVLVRFRVPASAHSARHRWSP
jgi:hypothetical protein